ncbi:hypothetical protein DWB77_00570 [Streptomyces hundungensis]|uniref:Uncharacterized protein n=1 Tax=Streptomyces hundungensis TaxID=1077946 RepID=A0A387H8H0_9ACTN|nr:hypothetical protein DWB77_00570 [Streptomyces hundungensis]
MPNPERTSPLLCVKCVARIALVVAVASTVVSRWRCRRA